MRWTTVAQGTSIDTIEETVSNFELPKGTPIRFIMQLNAPVAHAFDLWGVEGIFRPVMPDGVDLIDVHGEGNYTVIIDAEADPAWLLAIIVFIKAHWIALSLIAIGLTLALGLLVAAFKMEALVEVVGGAANVMMGAVIGLGIVGAIILLRPVVEKKTIKGGR